MAAKCNWKKTAVVPTAKDMIDIVLSKTQRKTPTEIHRQYPITRIREFYMRKVRFAQSCFEEKFNRIVQEFPRIDDVHPFYSDLLNVLYDRDHYKIALSQVNLAKTLVDHVARDYTRLLKYADSLFRCKQLKRAALGRMCTLVKRQTATLTYLEQVRQHLARLPSIDPTTRTVLIAGYPNVGKSSLLNRLTRADVQVDAYAFTTKSLYVGHAEHRYVPFQLIDTPGILDHPLDERNTIEMQSVTALAHLRALVLFVIDISELCGYPLEQQLALFRSIHPLFANKPVIVVLNKVDVRSLDQLGESQRASLDAFVKEFNVAMLTSEQMAQLDVEGDDNGEEQAPADPKNILPTNARTELLQKTLMMTMSTLTGVGVMEVKRVACDKLLQFRVEHKARSAKQRDTLLGRLYVSVPQLRDAAARPVCIPEAARKKMLERASTSAAPTRTGADAEEDEEDDPDSNAMYVDSEEEDQDAAAVGGKRKQKKLLKKRRKTERDLELELGDDYYLDLRKHWTVENETWRYDVLPEIVDGHNVADFVDPEIDRRLEELEREEQLLEQSGYYGRGDEDEDEDEETATRSKHVASLAKQIREKKQLRVLEHRAKKIRNATRLPRTAGSHKIRMQQVASTMNELGVPVRSNLRGGDLEDGVANLQHLSRERERGTKRKRSESVQRGRSRSVGERMDTDGDAPARDMPKRPKRDVSVQQVRSRERDSSMRPTQKKEAKRAERTVQKRVLALGKSTRAGEADRRILNLKPKHLFAGKRSNGKTDRR